jgi:hypothetical protein
LDDAELDLFLVQVDAVFDGASRDGGEIHLGHDFRAKLGDDVAYLIEAASHTARADPDEFLRTGTGGENEEHHQTEKNRTFLHEEHLPYPLEKHQTTQNVSQHPHSARGQKNLSVSLVASDCGAGHPCLNSSAWSFLSPSLLHRFPKKALSCETLFPVQQNSTIWKLYAKIWKLGVSIAFRSSLSRFFEHSRYPVLSTALEKHDSRTPGRRKIL